MEGVKTTAKVSAFLPSLFITFEWLTIEVSINVQIFISLFTKFYAIENFFQCCFVYFVLKELHIFRNIFKVCNPILIKPFLNDATRKNKN